VAIVLVVFFFVAFIKKGQYEDEARGSIMAVIRRETGFPYRKVVSPTPDGWVSVGKGDYRLPVEGKDENGDPVNKTRNPDLRISPVTLEWDVYPANPFLGMKGLQTRIRKQDWWENNPEPITRPGARTMVTAVDAQAHGREMDAMNIAIRIQEAEARQKQLMDMFSQTANKTLVYIMLGASILVGIIGAWQAYKLGDLVQKALGK
jgi:nitrogen fixation-related uncharacterized protein